MRKGRGERAGVGCAGWSLRTKVGVSAIKGERRKTGVSSSVREESQLADAQGATIVAFRPSACSRCGPRSERGRQDSTGEPTSE